MLADRADFPPGSSAGDSAMTPKNKAVFSAGASRGRAHPIAATSLNSVVKSSQGLVIGTALLAALMAAGCAASSPPAASYGPDLTGVEMMALRGDPYARAALTPMQRQRVGAYQASHPASAPTWGRDAANLAMGAGAGYLLSSTTSAARTGAAVTTGAATLAPEAAEVGVAETGAAVRGAAAVEEVGTAARGAAVAGEVGTAARGAVAVGEAVEIGAAATEAAEGAGLLEMLIEGCIFTFCR
jgi:hypothetical protein